MARFTFTSAREAQDWIDYQRDVRDDPSRWQVVRIEITKARP